MRPVSRPEKANSHKTADGQAAASPATAPSRLLVAACDVKTTAKEITVFVDLPGVDEDDISIAVESRALNISAERDFDHDNEDAEEYTHLGRPYGMFFCAVALPPNADTENMTAKYKRGVLKVRVPLEPNPC
ncbi:MAG TPA: Hsp20/alpha crystallin family protein [Fimbriimonadaceae bacterium]|nr:Hsp20/alpha crystallin family protein [Fimbriimonadaceae bacterium]